MTDTREFIIDQSYKLFLEKSYEAVSISDISTAIGFTKGALYHHFKNKEELFKAVIDKYLGVISSREVDEFVTVAKSVENTITYVDNIVRTICIDVQPFVPVNYMSLLIDALRHYPGYAEEKDAFFSRQIERLQGVLDEGVRSGELRPDIDTHAVALNFFSISVGIAANLFRENSPDQAIEAFKAQVNTLYKLIRNQP